MSRKRIIHESGGIFICFDLESQSAIGLDRLQAIYAVRDKDVLYVIEGIRASPALPSCVALFVSSPRSSDYRECVKNRTIEYCFPVFTWDELWNCSERCYPSFQKDGFDDNSHEYGGVARHLFSDCADLQDDANYVGDDPRIMDNALRDVNAVLRSIRALGSEHDLC